MLFGQQKGFHGVVEADVGAKPTLADVLQVGQPILVGKNE